MASTTPTAAAAATPREVTKGDVVEYLKAFRLLLDRDQDGVVTAVALQTFFRTVGEEVDEAMAKLLIRDLQIRGGCAKDVRAAALFILLAGRCRTRNVEVSHWTYRQLVARVVGDFS